MSAPDESPRVTLREDERARVLRLSTEELKSLNALLPEAGFETLYNEVADWGEDVKAAAHAAGVAQGKAEERKSWVCDGCMHRVYRNQIADMVDGEHVLCRWCDAAVRVSLDDNGADL